VGAQGTTADLERRVRGGHAEIQFAEPIARRAASDVLPNATPDNDQLTLQVPGDGSVASLRQLLDKLHEARIDVASLSLHTPDLDDVFFAVTGRLTNADADHEQKALQS